MHPCAAEVVSHVCMCHTCVLHVAHRPGWVVVPSASRVPGPAGDLEPDWKGLTEGTAQPDPWRVGSTPKGKCIPDSNHRDTLDPHCLPETPVARGGRGSRCTPSSPAGFGFLEGACRSGAGMWLAKGQASWQVGHRSTEVSAVGDWCEGGEPGLGGRGPWQKPGAKGGHGGKGCPGLPAVGVRRVL